MIPDRSTWKWFHLTSHTYGAWLPGDPRGFRTWKQHEHIEGDYKSPPPPGKYDDVFKRSKSLMKQGKVVLPPLWRAITGRAVLEKLLEVQAEVLCLSMSATHLHALARTPPGEFPRKWLGMAKKNASFAAHARGWVGNVWAKRSKPLPIRDRQHQLNTFGYIRKHIKEGAWVWDFRNGESPGTAVPGL